MPRGSAIVRFLLIDATNPNFDVGLVITHPWSSPGFLFSSGELAVLLSTSGGTMSISHPLTPSLAGTVFYQQVMRERLNREFNRAYRYIEVLYNGQNPYIEAIRNNITHLVKIISTGNWALLRREPPYFLGIVSAINDVEHYVTKQLARMTGKAIEKHELLMPV